MMDVPDYAIYITTGKRNRTPGVTTNSRMQKHSDFQRHCRRRWQNERHSDHGPAGHADGRRPAGKHPAHQQRRRHEGRCRDPIPRNWAPAILNRGGLGTLPAYGVFARHVKDLELANITVDFLTNDLRPAIVCSDVNGLEIDNFKAQAGRGRSCLPICQRFRSGHPQFARAPVDDFFIERRCIGEKPFQLLRTDGAKVQPRQFPGSLMAGKRGQREPDSCFILRPGDCARRDALLR